MVRRVEGREPSALTLVVVTFLLGIAAATIAIWINGFIAYLVDPSVPTSFDYFLFGDQGPSLMSGVLAGPVEETLKFFLLYEVVYHRKEFKSIRHGVIYAIICALGFSFVENTIYFINAAVDGDTLTLLAIGVVRAIGSTLIHVGAAVLVGWFVGMSKWAVRPRRVYIYVGLLCAIAFHSLSNYLIYVTPFGIIIVAGMAALIVAYVFKRIHLERMSTVPRTAL